ncbi:LuxR C-terminal-related transcriptional regulator [Mucilaginibacter sp. BJC16-A38]|uniref:helix-turn-helix domain-containing protein n=1 Tax=Mucilaginibacter phenanthrenivorans TaxID=1234842 RepID=UPI00280BB634|nr:LuxR C-terminal-related transcriptional regulator [Mucilaginibacter phenanthrenivorans]MCR8560435.1 LuxR C-terminal-related transcriptional regulator [Mucilaginibacter phenanthrenivorans]
MLVFGTQIHIVTFIFIVLEFCMFIFQTFYYLFRPQDKSRLWYLLLLLLFQFYNITGGLFPDPKIDIPVAVQEMLAYGSGFLMASFFPLYFYKAFDLKAIRWHALFGVPLFLMLPYFVFFVIAYAINGNLNIDIRFGMIVPLIYAVTLLYVIFRAIRKKHEADRDKNGYLEEIALYFAVVPWISLTFFGLIEENQLVEVLFTNTGIIVITILFIRKSIRHARLEYQLLQHVTTDGARAETFRENCLHYGLTKTEIQIAELLYKGLSNKEIADKLFISQETVKKHIYNMFRKTAVKNRSGLLHTLQKTRF